MTEPTTSSAFAIWLSILTTTLFKDVNADALIGAICGGLVFMIYAQERKIIARFLLMAVSVIIGYHAAPDIASFLKIESQAVAASAGSSIIIWAILEAMSKIKALNLEVLLLAGIDKFFNLLRRK